MAKQVSLKVSSRTGLGRQAVKKARTASMIPAIVYGSHIKPTPIQVAEREIERIFKHATSENMLVELSLEENGKPSNRLAFIQEIQHHPITDRILHLDFHEVRSDEKLHARVLIVPIGEPEGVRTGGGVLEHALRELEVECFPKDLPDHIEVDVSALQIGGNIHVEQLKVPAEVTVLNPPTISVFTVLAPAKEEVAAPTATELTEPEVIKQKKIEGEEAPAEGKAEGKGAAKTSEAKKAPEGKSGEAKGAEAKGGAKGAPAKQEKK